MPDPVAPTPPTDDELNVYILTRYALLGIDISVLPVDDPDAVMDQQRLLADGRRILRAEVLIADAVVDSQFAIPSLYPSALSAWTTEAAR